MIHAKEYIVAAMLDQWEAEMARGVYVMRELPTCECRALRWRSSNARLAVRAHHLADALRALGDRLLAECGNE